MLLMSGSKIKLVKEIPGLRMQFKVGDIFTVEEVLGNNYIKFGSFLGNGIMSLQEFDEYFEVITEEWSSWEPVNPSYYKPYFDEKFSAVYRTNGHTVEVKSFGFNDCLSTENRAFAKCSPSDEFDLEKGVKIALLKLLLELYTA